MTPRQLMARLALIEREERRHDARLLVVMATAARGEGSDIETKLRELMED